MAKRKAKQKTEIKEKKVRQVPDEEHFIIIEGRARFSQSFNLPHDVYCKLMGKCHCRKQARVTSFRSTVDRMRHTKTEEILVCCSLTIGFGERKAIPKAMLQCPEVVSAIKSKPPRLRVRG